MLWKTLPMTILWVFRAIDYKLIFSHQFLTYNLPRIECDLVLDLMNSLQVIIGQSLSLSSLIDGSQANHFTILFQELDNSHSDSKLQGILLSQDARDTIREVEPLQWQSLAFQRVAPWPSSQVNMDHLIQGFGWRSTTHTNVEIKKCDR